MWIKFWFSINCSTSKNINQECQYHWFDSNDSDESFTETAEELIPSWAKDTERGCIYGFERLTDLPEDEKAKQIQKYEQNILYAQKMLKILNTP